MGPATRAPVRRAVSTMSVVDLSCSWWSKVRRRIRILVASAMKTKPFGAEVRRARKACPPRGSSLDDLGHDAGADGLAAFPDREAHLFLERHRRDELDLHRDVVAGHHHLHAFRQLH